MDKKGGKKVREKKRRKKKRKKRKRIEKKKERKNRKEKGVFCRVLRQHKILLLHIHIGFWAHWVLFFPCLSLVSESFVSWRLSLLSELHITLFSSKVLSHAVLHFLTYTIAYVKKSFQQFTLTVHFSNKYYFFTVQFSKHFISFYQYIYVFFHTQFTLFGDIHWLTLTFTLTLNNSQATPI